MPTPRKVGSMNHQKTPSSFGNSLRAICYSATEQVAENFENLRNPREQWHGSLSELPS